MNISHDFQLVKIFGKKISNFVIKKWPLVEWDILESQRFADLFSKTFIHLLSWKGMSNVTNKNNRRMTGKVYKVKHTTPHTWFFSKYYGLTGMCLIGIVRHEKSSDHPLTNFLNTLRDFFFAKNNNNPAMVAMEELAIDSRLLKLKL